MALRSCEEHISTLCASLLVVHSAVSTMTHLLKLELSVFCSSAPGCYLHLQVPDLATLPAAAMPAKDTTGGCVLRGDRPFGFVKTLTNPTRQHMTKPLFCGLAEDTLCTVAAGSVGPAGTFLNCAMNRFTECGHHVICNGKISRPAVFFSYVHHRLAESGRHALRLRSIHVCEILSVVVLASSDAPARAFLS